jgi:hypothetical protein
MIILKRILKKMGKFGLDSAGLVSGRTEMRFP